MRDFEEFETPAILSAIQTINLRITGDIQENKVDLETRTASMKMGRMLEELKIRDDQNQE